MIYEYKCPECGEVMELDWSNRTTIPSYVTCTSCGWRSPRKYSSFQFIFSPYLKEPREGNMVDY